MLRAYEIEEIEHVFSDPEAIAEVDTYQQHTAAQQSGHELALRPFPHDFEVTYRDHLHMITENAKKYDPETEEVLAGDLALNAILAQRKNSRVDQKDVIRAVRARRTIGVLAMRHARTTIESPSSESAA
jgi:hypothetical protein